MALEAERAELGGALSHLLSRVFVLENAAPRQGFYRSSAAPEREAPAAPIVASPAVAASAALGWEPLQMPLLVPGAGPAPTPPPPDRPAVESSVSDNPTAEPPASLEPPPAPPARIEWEQWIGVRGAAALGAGILVIALLFFVRYSVDQGWLSPTLRVLFGAGFSAALLGVAQLRLNARYTVLSNWLSGAAVAGLFASLWAAHHIVPILGAGTSFVAFIALAAGSLTLATTRNSMPIALLGAAGGFAAPLAIAANHERPLGVIAYVLVLDAALLVLAVRKRWWVLSALALLASSAYEAVWLSAHAATGIAPLHVAIVIIFAALFGAAPAFAVEREAEAATSPARLLRLAALVLPFLFALRLVSTEAIVDNPAPIGVLLVSVTLLACGLARVRREHHGLMLVALGNLAVLLAWGRRAALEDHVVIASALALALSLPFVGLAWIERATKSAVREQAGNAGATVVAAMTILVALAAASSTGPVLLPLIVLGGLSVCGLAISRWAAVTRFASVSLTGAAAAIAFVGASPMTTSAGAGPGVAAVLTILLLVVFAMVASRRRAASGAREPEASEWAASAQKGVTGGLVLATVVMLPLAGRLPVGAYTLLLSAIVACGVVEARGRKYAHASLALTLLLPMVAFSWQNADASTLHIALAAGFLTSGLAAASFWPRLGLVEHPAMALANTAIIVAGAGSLVPRLIDAPLASLGTLFLVVAAFAAVTLAAMVTLTSTARDEAQKWLGSLAVMATTLSLLALFRNEQLTWSIAAFGLALILLGVKLGRRAAIFAGLAHLISAAVRLTLNPWLLDYHPRGATPIINWITPTFLLPVFAFAAAWWLLSRREGPDDDEVDVLPQRVTGALALLVPFVWLNVCVLDIYSAGPRLALTAGASEAQNLSISAVWAAYGVGLLVLGLSRKSAPLRWTSLGLVLITAGKVFVYDLGNLQDLYRVASLAGLALSLLAISVLYQRFVFGPRVGGAGGA